MKFGFGGTAYSFIVVASDLDRKVACGGFEVLRRLRKVRWQIPRSRHYPFQSFVAISWSPWLPRACCVLRDNARGGQPLLCPRLFSLYSRAILDGSCRRRTSAKVAISPAGGRRRGHPLSWSRSRVEVLLHLLALMQRLFPGHSLAASLRTCLLKHLARPTCAATPGTTAGPPPVAAGSRRGEVLESSWESSHASEEPSV